MNLKVKVKISIVKIISLVNFIKFIILSTIYSIDRDDGK